MRPASTPARGVLFDVDGTLVDSTYLHTVSWWRAFRRFGHDVPMASIHRSIGMGADQLIEHLLDPGRDREEDAQLEATHGAVFSTLWPALRILDGADDLLYRCKDAGLAVVLASSASERDLSILRATINADPAITAATSSADARRSKPAPDILLAALDAAELDASAAVFVGDAVWDIQAASEVGIPTIALTCGGTSEAELRDAGAIEVHPGPRALLEAFAESRLGELARDVRDPATAVGKIRPQP